MKHMNIIILWNAKHTYHIDILDIQLYSIVNMVIDSFSLLIVLVSLPYSNEE